MNTKENTLKVRISVKKYANKGTIQVPSTDDVTQITICTALLLITFYIHIFMIGLSLDGFV